MKKFLLLAVLVLAAPVFAQDKPSSRKRPVSPDVQKLVKDKSAEDIAALLRAWNEKPLPVDDVDTVAEFKRKKGLTLIGLADSLLNTGPDDNLAEEANKMKINGLGLLMQLKPDDVAKITALKRELEKEGKFPKVVAECDAYLYIGKIRKILLSKRVSEKDFLKIAEELKPLVKEHPESPYVSAAGLLLSAAGAFEGNSKEEGFANKIRNDFIKTFRESGNEKLIKAANMIDLDAQSAVVPGKRLQIAGMTVDGKPFDLKMLRGKVVLIDFWATWCGPCRGEIPNMRTMYAKYNARGFEIVGISIDKDVSALQSFLVSEKIPWTSISDQATIAAGMPSLAERYGVRGIPTMYLLDQDGRVISTSARGGELQRLLEAAFR